MGEVAAGDVVQVAFTAVVDAPAGADLRTSATLHTPSANFDVGNSSFPVRVVVE